MESLWLEKKKNTFACEGGLAHALTAKVFFLFYFSFFFVFLFFLKLRKMMDFFIL